MNPAVYPLTLRIAADARTGHTTYADDQSWEVAIGQQDQPAIALQTRYGGRVGLLRLVPMIRGNSQVLYETQHFASPFKVTSLAPNAVRLEADITAGLTVALYAWIIHSQAIGGSLIFANKTKQSVALTADLFAQAMREKQTIPMSLLSLETPQGMTIGLAPGKIANLYPVLLMEHAQENDSPKLSSPLKVPAGKTASVNFVMASLTQLEKSLEEAYIWLYNTDWNAHRKALNYRMAQLPTIETGDETLDAAIFLTQQTALRSVIGKTSQFPAASPVFVRLPSMGFSPDGTGADHIRPWEGQNALDTLQLASTLAPLDVSLVKGFIQNYLAVQQENGFIDAIPGAAGQREGVLLAPVLAQMAVLVYQYSHDKTFITNIFPHLLKFYMYWFAQDADSDGYPEWQTAVQTSLDYHPTFLSLHQSAGDSLVALIESPDLATYLLHEGRALAKLAQIAGRQTDWKKAAKYHEKLKAALMEAWQDNHFIYRHRDSHRALVGEVLFKSKGDLTLPAPVSPAFPQNVVIQIEGGTSRPKLLKVTLEGIDKDGSPAVEVIENSAFSWYRARGAATTRTVWQRIDHLTVEGLSRVYEYQVKTPDISQRDLSLLLPYTTGILTEAQSKAILKELKEKYWREYGLVACESPTREGLENRMILPWVTMFGLTLPGRASAELFEQVTAAQTKALREQGSFFQWYDAVNGTGVGFQEHTTGLVPLHWLMQLIGVIVIDGGTVELVGEFGLKKKVTVAHHGVKIARSSRKLAIKFASGHTVELSPDAPPQIIRDPRYQPSQETFTEPATPRRLQKAPVAQAIRISLEDS